MSATELQQRSESLFAKKPTRPWPALSGRAPAPPLGGALAEGFVVLTRRGVFRSWMVVVYAALIVVALALLAAAGPLALELKRAGLLSHPGAGGLILVRLRPWCPVFLVMAVALYAVIATAVERAVLCPDERSFAYLRCGADEVRRVVCALTSFGVTASAGALALLAGAAIEAVAAVLVYAITGDASAEPIFTSSAVLLPLLGIGAMAVVGARLSLSPSIAFVSGRIDPRLSWRLTHGRTSVLVRVRLLRLLAAGLGLGAALLIGLAPGPVLSPEAAGVFMAFRAVFNALLWPAAALAAAVGALSVGPALWLRLQSEERDQKGG
jgi:hypothetical protein